MDTTSKRMLLRFVRIITEKLITEQTKLKCVKNF